MSNRSNQRLGMGYRMGVSLSAISQVEPLETLSLTSDGGSMAAQKNPPANSSYDVSYAYQPAGNSADDFLLTDTSHFFAIVGLPRANRQMNRRMSIAGSAVSAGRAFHLACYGDDYVTSSFRSRFGWKHQGATGVSSGDVTSPVWDEDSALVVVTRTGSGTSFTIQVDWYSLVDGTKHAGTPNSTGNYQPVGAFSASRFAISQVSGSTTPSTDISPPSGAFSGSIKAIGAVNASVADATWQSIALGGEIVSTIDADATATTADITYLRDYDESTGKLEKPSAATADDSSAIVFPAANDNWTRGPNLTRQDTSSYVRLNELPHKIVYGAVVGGTTAKVPFSGEASGSQVTCSVFRLDTGEELVKGVMPVSGGSFSGTLDCPQSTARLGRQVKLTSNPSVLAQTREELGVGWHFIIHGQSQATIGFQDVTDDVGGVSTSDADKLTIAGIEEPDDDTVRIDRCCVYGYGRQVSNHLFAKYLLNQIQEYSAYDGYPIQLTRSSVGGNSMVALLSDTISGTSWEWNRDDYTYETVEAVLDVVGDQVTAIIHNWATSDASLNGDYDVLLDWAYRGVDNDYETVTSGDKDHNWTQVLQSGFSVIMMPYGRNTSTLTGPFDTDSQTVNVQNLRDTQREWGETYPSLVTVGPETTDLELSDSGDDVGPHQTENLRGNARIAERYGMGIARLLGWDTNTNPTIDETSARFSTTSSFRDTILFEVNIPNGGILVNGNGDGTGGTVTAIEVGPSGSTVASHAATGGFTATIDNEDNGDGTATVKLVKDSGVWNSTDILTFYKGSPMGYGRSSVPTVDEKLDGFLYEDTSGTIKSALGLGLPVQSLADDVPISSS